MRHLTAIGLVLVAVSALSAPAHASGKEWRSEPFIQALARSQHISVSSARRIIENQSLSIVLGRKITKIAKIPVSAMAINDDGSLAVSVTSVGQETAVRALGGSVKLVPRSAATVADLDAKVRDIVETEPVAKGMNSYGPDATNGVEIVRATLSFWETPQGKEISKLPGVARIDVPAGSAIAADALVAGWWMGVANAFYCTAGVPTIDGEMYSVGHCTKYNGTLGWPVYNAAGTVVGYTDSSRYQNGGYDMGRVRLTTTMSPIIANYSSGTTTIAGPAYSITGEFICKFGTTTGVTCGRVTSLDQTVSVSGALVSGEDGSTICGEHGDSGAPVTDGSAATNRVLGLFSAISANVACGKNSYSDSAGMITSWYSDIETIISYYGSTILYK